MRRAIRLLVLLAIVGAVCIASSQTRGPQWTVHCEMACTDGYRSGWDDSEYVNEAHAKRLADEFQTTCYDDLITGGCEMPSCRCEAVKR
jgi:hypothetical protein